MILHESIFITTISGYFGLLIGVGLLNFIGDKLEEDYITDPSIDISTGIAATILLIIFGAFAGYLPAKRAAQIKPIEALETNNMKRLFDKDTWQEILDQSKKKQNKNYNNYDRSFMGESLST